MRIFCIVVTIGLIALGLWGLVYPSSLVDVDPYLSHAEPFKEAYKSHIKTKIELIRLIGLAEIVMGMLLLTLRIL